MRTSIGVASVTDEVGLPDSTRAENLGMDLRDHSLSQSNNLLRIIPSCFTTLSSTPYARKLLFHDKVLRFSKI